MSPASIHVRREFRSVAELHDWLADACGFGVIELDDERWLARVGSFIAGEAFAAGRAVSVDLLLGERGVEVRLGLAS